MHASFNVNHDTTIISCYSPIDISDKTDHGIIKNDRGIITTIIYRTNEH